MDYKTEEQVLFLSFVLLLTTGACFWGCAYGGCLTTALPATRERANQSKSLLFCNDSDKIFFSDAISKGYKWDKSYTYYRQSFPLKLWFQRRTRQPHGFPLLPFSPPCPLPAPGTAVPFQSCWYSCFWKLGEPRPANSYGWMKGKKRVSHPKQKSIAVCLPPCSSVFTGYLLLPKEPLLT